MRFWFRSNRKVKPAQRPRLLLQQLEERQMFSTAPLPHVLEPVGLIYSSSGGGDVWHLSAEGDAPTGEQTNPLLRDGPEANQAPVFGAFPPVILGEDPNNHVVNLLSAFHDPDGPANQLQFRVLDVSLSDLIDRAVIDGSRLIIDVAPNAYGNASITVQATDRAGASAQGVLRVQVLPVNDRPTTSGISGVTTTIATRDIVIDLFATFDDVEDGPTGLTYSLVQNTNPALFKRVLLDQAAGKLILTLDPAVTGRSLLTLRATDSEGAYVETTLADANYPVYQHIHGFATLPNASQLGLQHINLVTSWWLFEYSNGVYHYDRFSEAKLRYYLRSPYYDPSKPLVLDIENPYYTNTPVGRERFAEIMRVLWDERPDAYQVGQYLFLPDRAYHFAVGWPQAQYDLARNVYSWYTVNAAMFQAEYLAWHNSNAQYREAALRDGTFLADYYTLSSPSLYTLRKGDYAIAAGQLQVPMTIHGAGNYFEVRDVLMADGMHVQFNQGTQWPIPAGFFRYVDYYTVNVQGSRFQLSLTPNGPPINLAPNASGNTYLDIWGPRNFFGHDLDSLNWKRYAEENIAEARKFNNPVIAWLTPTMEGLNTYYLEKEFFRLQLDITRSLADGFVIWHDDPQNMLKPENQGWLEALEEFMRALRSPTQFEIRVINNGVDLPVYLNGQRIVRQDRFLTQAFASGGLKLDAWEQTGRPSNPGAPDPGEPTTVDPLQNLAFRNLIHRFAVARTTPLNSSWSPGFRPGRNEDWGLLHSNKEDRWDGLSTALTNLAVAPVFQDSRHFGTTGFSATLQDRAVFSKSSLPQGSWTSTVGARSEQTRTLAPPRSWNSEDYRSVAFVSGPVEVNQFSASTRTVAPESLDVPHGQTMQATGPVSEDLTIAPPVQASRETDADNAPTEPEQRLRIWHALTLIPLFPRPRDERPLSRNRGLDERAIRTGSDHCFPT